MALSNSLQDLSETIKSNRQADFGYLIIDCRKDSFHNFTPEQFNAFGQLLAKFDNLYALNLSYGHLKLWGSLQFKCLGDILTNHKSLIHLDLTSNDFYLINDINNIQALASIFPKCDFLESIDLSNNRIYLLNESFLNVVAKQLAACKNIEHIKIKDSTINLNAQQKQQRKNILTKFENSLCQHSISKARLNCKAILIIFRRLYPDLAPELTNMTFQFANYIAQQTNGYNLSQAKIKSTKITVTL